MNCEYDTENKYLRVDGNDISAYDCEENEVGVCSICQSDLMSISYHSFEDKILVEYPLDEEHIGGYITEDRKV